MPIHLLPVSRRRFLTSSLAAGIGILTKRQALGDQLAEDAHRWVLLADTHIAADQTLVSRGVNMTNNLTRVAAAVTALEPRPAGVVLNGDVAYLKGEAEDYTQAAKLLKPLVDAQIPLHMTLGNHDERDRFRAGLHREAARSPLESRVVTVVETARANWFFLDSLDRVNATPGELGKQQLGWLARALDARPKKPALVVLHHNPQLPLPSKPTGLVDTEQFFAVLVPRQQVKAVIFGHTHQWRLARHERIHLVNLPPVAYLFNKEAPNGWIDLRLRDEGALLTLNALDPNHRQNGEKVELSWR